MVKPEPVVETFAVTATLFPTVEGEVTEIKGIRVQHNEGASLVALPTEWTLTNEAGGSYEIKVEWLFTDFDDMLITVNPSITAAGTYTLTIPAASLETEDGKVCEAATFSWTIAKQAEGGDETAIDAAAADAEFVIYDITGRRVKEATKGIYIINGKKVVK